MILGKLLIPGAAPAPYYYDSGEYISEGSTGSNILVPYPTQVESGDLLILHVGIHAATLFGTPSGWTLIGRNNYTHSIGVFGRIATGSESGYVTVSKGGSTVQAAGVISSFKNTRSYGGSSGSFGRGNTVNLAGSSSSVNNTLALVIASVQTVIPSGYNNLNGWQLGYEYSGMSTLILCYYPLPNAGISPPFGSISLPQTREQVILRRTLYN